MRGGCVSGARYKRRNTMSIRFIAATTMASVFALALAPVVCAQATYNSQQTIQTNLVSDLSNGINIDIKLRNPWGIARSSTGAWWVADNTTGLATVYDGTTGAPNSLVVTIPPADPKVTSLGSPTGIVFNGGGGFNVAPALSAKFLFATMDGTISGWNPAANATKAIITVKEKGSYFTGLTMAQIGTAFYPPTYLYAADFANDRIAVFDTNFQHVTQIEQRIASIQVPAGYVPFNIQNLGGNLYVALALKGGNNHEVFGNGLGIVAVISPDGNLIQTFQTGSFLNAPWGLAIAPSDFGAFSHDLLVSNVGNGTVAAFDPITGKFKAYVRCDNNLPVVVLGIKAISVGSGTELGGSATSLFFAAGPNKGLDGLFGNFAALSNPSGNDQ
jgi:uncharacterized protein (TIGR03118 family)